MSGGAIGVGGREGGSFDRKHATGASSIDVKDDSLVVRIEVLGAPALYFDSVMKIADLARSRDNSDRC